MKVFSGSSNAPLVEKICANLSIPVGKIELKTFPSGEKYCQFQENIRGTDTFLVQPLSTPANDNLMELLVMCDAARRASAGRITAVIPYFGYARQDRKEKSRVPISAKLIMDLIEAAGVNRILTMDLHSPQTAGFTNLPIDQLIFKPALIDALKGMTIDAVVAPDIGSVKRADEYASALKTDLVIISKKRSNETTVETKHFIGNVEKRNVIIIDDLTESAGTLIEAAKACKDLGACEIYCAVSHGCFTWLGNSRLVEAFKAGLINRLFVSNSVSVTNIVSQWQESGGLYGHGIGVPIPTQADKVTIVDVSPWFAKAIKNIHQNESISELFK
jgi:ribose-phosphate pyrophosphokinase